MMPNRFKLSGIKTSRSKEKESCMKKIDVEKDEKIEEPTQKEDQQPQDNIFSIEEIRIEELAVDGICGVY